MNKHNSLLKKINHRFLSINNSIESYFNKFKSFKKILKKMNLLGIIKFFSVYRQLLF